MTERQAVATRRRRTLPGQTEKLSVTVPADVLAEANAQVVAGRAPSLSAYVSDALANQIAADQERARSESFLAFLDQLDTELGPPSEEAFAWARQVAGLT